MNCVNIASKEFKRLASDNNVSSGTLEQIVHKYYIERGNDEIFPSNIYIQAQLGNIPYKESGSNVIKLWQKAYSTPRKYSSEKEYQNAKREAERYFPQAAIVTYINAENNYVLAIRKPVRNLSASLDKMLDTFPNTENSMKAVLKDGYHANNWSTSKVDEVTIKSAINDYLSSTITDIPRLERYKSAINSMTKDEITALFDSLAQEQNDFNLIKSKVIAESAEMTNFANKQILKSYGEVMSPTLMSSISTGNWNPQSINEFNNLVNQIKDGKIDFKRTVGERVSYAKGISEIHAGASIVTRGTYGTDRSQQSNPLSEYQREAAQGKQQEKRLESWAKANDLWLNDYTDEAGNKANTLEDLLHSQWKYMDQGSEAEVFRYDDNTVLKSINLSHSNDNPAKALDKIALFNQLFPETALSVVGFGRDSLGHFRIIVLQDLIRGKELTDAELDDFHKKYNFTKSGAWFSTNDNTALITDLSNSNIVKDANGNYFVIDADVVYNTPAHGGNVLFENSLSELNKRTTNNIQIEDNTRFSTHSVDPYQRVPGSSETTENRPPRTYTAKAIHQILKTKFEENSPELKLADFVFKALEGTGIKFREAELSSSNTDTIAGKFSASENTVFYNPNVAKPNTLLHEAIHAATAYYLNAANTEGFSTEVKIALKEIEECYDLLKQDFIKNLQENGKIKEGVNPNKVFSQWATNDLYGLTSPEEMIAEISNPKFIEHIRDFDRRHKEKNIFQKLINAIASLFGINKNYGPLEATVKKALVTLLTKPNAELRKRYALENATIKKNIRSINESSHVELMSSSKASEIIEKASKNNNKLWADTELKLSVNEAERILKISDDVKETHFSKWKQGTIITNEESGITLATRGDVTLDLNNDVVTIPVRLYSKTFLQSHKLSVEKGENGLSYIKNVTPLFNTETLGIDPAQEKQSIIKQIVNHISQSLGVKIHTDKESMDKRLKELEKKRQDIQLAAQERREMQEIRERAIAKGDIVLKEDGSFDYALAPNGERSNLNERQWLQVRTKAFKKWFGDWEKVISTVKLLEKSHTGTGRTHFYEYNINESDGYISISVDTKLKTINITGIEATKGKGLGINSYIAVQNKFPGYTINSDADALSNDATNMWERMVSKGIAVKNAEKDYTLTLPSVSKVVDKNGEPLVVYHTIGSTEDLHRISIFDRNTRKSRGKWLYYFSDNAESSKSYLRKDYSPIFDKTKSYSDILDYEEDYYETSVNILRTKNGFDDAISFIREELNRITGEVSTRHTNYNGLLVNYKHFENQTKEDKRIAFEYAKILDNLVVARDFRNSDYNTQEDWATHAVFLNIRNPFSIDAKGKNWDEFEYSIRQRTNKYLEDYYLDERKKNNNDGLEVDNYIDTANYKDERQIVSTTYAVDSSTQIKSATDNNGDFSNENPDIQMAIDREENQMANDNSLPSKEEQLAWVNEHKDELVKQYLEQHKNTYDPDKIRDLLSPLGYDKSNLDAFYSTGVELNKIIMEELFKRLATSDNKTITILTGAPGSGKSFATESRKKDFEKRGLVLDAPFHTVTSLEEVIKKAREAGVEDKNIQVIAVYNDALTTYKNSISRGKKTNRWLPVSFFLSSFRRNREKINELINSNPDIDLITIDNSNNQNKEVSIEEATKWDYEINSDIIGNIVKQIRNDEGIDESTKERLLKGFNAYRGRENYSTGYNEATSRGRQTVGRGVESEIHDVLRKTLGLDANSIESKRLNTLLVSAKTFLSHFDITFKDASAYNGEVPLFDALNRVINIKNANDVTEGVGYAIAFMMQWHPAFRTAVEMKMMDRDSTSLKGIRRSIRKRGTYNAAKLTTLQYKRLDRDPYIAEVGHSIASELRKFYNLEKSTEEKTSFIKKVWNTIIEFFKIFDANTRNEFREAYYFASDAAFAVATNNEKFIRYSNLKPGAESKGSTSRVDIAQALKDSPYEESIISALNEDGIGLAGGASIATFGTLMRPSENPLHDLDFNVPSNIKTSEDIENVVNKHFQYNTKTNTIKNGDKTTYTYLILDRPFKVKASDTFITQKNRKIRLNDIVDANTGEIIGSYFNSELTLADGVKGKFLDFFVGSNSKILTKTINGKEYKISDYKTALAAKIDWRREKDLWDYNNFKLFDEKPNPPAFYKTSDGDVYGFVDPETGDIYLDGEAINPEHPIHEYTHIWDKAVAERNPELWAKGVELLKEFKINKNKTLWEKIENDPNYGKKWQEYKTSDPEKYEFLIASEVHARLVGEHGAAFIEKYASQNGSNNLIEKLKQWIVKIWGEIAKTFGKWEDKDLKKLQLSDFNHMTIRDLINGTKLSQETDNLNRTDESSLRKSGQAILEDKGIKRIDRHSNGHVRGGQSGWKVRFIIKNPDTGKAFTADEFNNNRNSYFENAKPLLNYLKEYFKNPDTNNPDTIEQHLPQSDGYSAHYIYTDSNGNKREPFKFLSGGEVGGSDFTIYIGSREDVDKFISDIQNSPVYDLLAEGNDNNSDTSFNDKIHGRVEGRDIGFSGYMLPEGLEKMLPDNSVVYKDDRVEIFIEEDLDTNKKVYVIKDLKTGVLKVPNYTNNESETTAVGYVNKNIKEIRQQIAENVYGEYITGSTSLESNRIKETVYYEKLNDVLKQMVKNINDSGITSAVPIKNLYEWTIQANEEVIKAIRRGERSDNYIDADKAQKQLQNILKKTPKELGDSMIQALKEMSRLWGRQSFTQQVPQTQAPQKAPTTQGTLNISPAKSIDAKARVKGAMSNKFIGFGTEGSSTNEYAKQAGDRANVGTYNENDVVFVSVMGRSRTTDETTRHQMQDKTIKEAIKAICSGATLVTDSSKYLDTSDYNEGEKRLAKALKDIGAIYTEHKDNNKIGIWKMPPPPGPETEIDIWWGSGEKDSSRQNADLSNFAERPFTISEDFYVDVDRDISQGTLLIDDGNGKYRPMHFRNVESAFQYLKNHYRDSWEGYSREEYDALIKAGKNPKYEPLKYENTTGAEAKSLGRKIQDLNTEAWDKDSAKIMKALLLESFRQNPEALQRLLATGDATLTHKKADNPNAKVNWGKEFPRLLMEVRSELREEQKTAGLNSDETINDNNNRSNETESSRYISATIAPYYNTSYNDYTRMSQEEKDKMRKAFSNAAKQIAKMLGIPLEAKNIVTNIGGYQFEDGSSVTELSYTFNLNTTPEKARLFAALMGDFGFEQQEAVVTSYDITNYEEADGIRYSVELEENQLSLLEKYNIKNFTYNKTKKELSVLSFDKDDVDNFNKLITELNDGQVQKRNPRTTPFKSTFDEKVRRKALYRKWITSNPGETGTELYSSIQSALRKVSYYSGVPSSYDGIITPSPDTIFVFGSNPEGRHGAGAAKTAKDKFGAIYGQGEGLQGNSYALPTKDLRVKENNGRRSIPPKDIINNIKRMYKVANANPDKLFKVAYTNSLDKATLNGYTGAEMIKMFKDAGPIPVNVIFSKEWTQHWDEVQSSLPTSSSDAILAQFKNNIDNTLAGYFEGSGANIKLDFPSLPNALIDKLNNHFMGGTELSRDDYRELWKYIEFIPNLNEESASQSFIPVDKKLKAQRTNTIEVSENGETMEFSPMAEREFTMSTFIDKEGIHFTSIEQAFQYHKLLEMHGEMEDNVFEDWKTKILNASPSEARELGNKIPMSNAARNTWKDSAYDAMENILTASFEQNPEAAKKLIETGDKPFTFPQGEGNLKTAYPEILSSVREELRQKPVETAPETAPTTDTTQNTDEDKSETTDSPETKKKVDKEVAKVLDEYEKLTQQINNLLDSNIITASEVRHIAEQVVNSISDNITSIQQEEGLAQKQFKNLKTDMDFKKATRREVIDAIGIGNLIYRAKLLFTPTPGKYKDILTLRQAALICNNWDAIMTLASDIFAMNEGFGIAKNYEDGGVKIVDGETVGYDNFDGPQDADDVREQEGDEQEHWQVESRTIDVLNSMSAMVRQALHQCYLMETVDGKETKKYSKWGIAERVNPREATNSILRWTQGALSVDEMVEKLSEKKDKHPWLKQLIQRLSDKTGKETDFQGQFYSVFSKHFQLYSIVLYEDKKYHSMVVNNHPALTEVMNSIISKYRIGSHALFTNSGINVELLKGEGVKSLTAVFKDLEFISGILETGKELDAEDVQLATQAILRACDIFGCPNITEEMVQDVLNEKTIGNMTRQLGFIITNLTKAIGKKYDPFAYKKEGQEVDSIKNTLQNFLAPILEPLEDVAINAFYDSGKMYQSYVTPSYMTKLMQKFKKEGKDFDDFMQEEYGFSEWFKDSKRGWKNELLRLLSTEDRKKFAHKVELNFNKHNYMRNMSDAEYTLSLITEYFSVPENEKDLTWTWFRMPMQSNKPSSEYLKLPSYRDAFYKNTIVSQLFDMYLQELGRIQTVLMRNKGKKSIGFIKNFDTNGRKFNFLPFLNSYLESSESAKAAQTLIKNADSTVSAENGELATLLQLKLQGTTKLSSAQENRLRELIKKAIRSHMEERTKTIMEKWKKNGINEAAKKIEGVGKTDEAVNNAIENFLWNDALASKHILQLTIGDIAFYKDAEDLQKRLAQLHAPGLRGNIDARDYKTGELVSDGIYRTIVLADWEDFVSNIVSNIKTVFERKIERASSEEEKESLRTLMDSLIRPRTYNEDGSVKDEGGKYWNINVADAQAFSSPSSRRKKDMIFGRWSLKAEEIYEKLLRGEATYAELEVAFQPEKPFLYSRLHKDMGVEGAPITKMSVPFQAKNAEYLLIMADALLRGENTGKPNLLRAIYRVMEESERINPTRGIDTVQFESAIKSGLQGKMNIHQFADMADGEERAYSFMMNQIYKEEYTDASKTQRVYREYDTVNFVHEASFEDYCLQQEVPEHFKDHSQAHGSQIRMIIPSDLDLYKNPNGDKNDPDNQVWYEWEEPDGKGGKIKRRARADEFRKEYEETIADNIRESIINLRKELKLDTKYTDKKERNIALSRILQREIISSPRYGIDLMQACSIDKETGEFRIPKGDPIQAKRIEQLINSIIKNRVNKQKIAGGPIVQVSNFGTSKRLHIRFKDKSGKLLMTEGQFKGAKTKYKTYEEYKNAEQAGIAYFEVLVPIWSKEIFEKFANSDGTINVKAMEKVDPDLLKMVSYRIPTEDKYSCAPMKVVGFMPKEAGEAIMLPYELTTIDDSDFDVDKRYVMRKDIKIVEDKKYIRQAIKKALPKELILEHNNKKTGGENYIEEQVKAFLKDPEGMKNENSLMETFYKEYVIIKKRDFPYKTIHYTEGKKFRDNKIVDMTWGVLTNEMTADKILNPGGFDGPKKIGYMVTAYKNTNLSWDELKGKSINELKDLSYTNKDLTWADTQVQFYKQNSAAASLIGVFAVNKVSHAVLESNGIVVAVDEVCGERPFSIAGFEFKDDMEVDAKYDRQGNLIGKTLGSLVSASADAVKDPILNLMNINMSTANILNTLLRMRMSFEDSALFLSQNIIEKALIEFNKKSLSKSITLDNVIEKMISEYEKKYGYSSTTPISTQDLSKEELIKGLKEGHPEIEYKTLIAFQKVKKISDVLRNLNTATKFNSISSSVGPLIVDNLILEHKVEKFTAGYDKDGTHLYSGSRLKENEDGNPAHMIDISYIFKHHPILSQFHEAVGIASQMFSDMPAGSTGFRNILSTLNGLNPVFAEKFYRDKKLLDQLSMFYQSYMLVKSGVINPENRKDLIDNFPKEFASKNYDKEYPDNALIQAIKLSSSKKTNRAFLTIALTGLDQQAKETLSSAWIDLHKKNPELSKKLFEYCFFRAGVGFSPKTFMALVPTYVKEHLSTDLKDGKKATYIDTYRHFPGNIVDRLVIDQFIRNNWNEKKLVPKKGGNDTHYRIDYNKGKLIVDNEKDLNDIKGVLFMKTNNGADTYLWRLSVEESKKDEKVFYRVDPLGENGEYLEISTKNIIKASTKVTQDVEDLKESEFKEMSPAETDAEQPSDGNKKPVSEEVKEISEFAQMIMRKVENVDAVEAQARAEAIKKNPSIFKKFIFNVFKNEGIEVSESDVLKKFKELNLC